MGIYERAVVRDGKLLDDVLPVTIGMENDEVNVEGSQPGSSCEVEKLRSWITSRSSYAFLSVTPNLNAQDVQTASPPQPQNDFLPTQLVSSHRHGQGWRVRERGTETKGECMCVSTCVLGCLRVCVRT